MFDPPSADHWLGTDEIGRDMLSRVIVGTRITLAIAWPRCCSPALPGLRSA